MELSISRALRVRFIVSIKRPIAKKQQITVTSIFMKKLRKSPENFILFKFTFSRYCLIFILREPKKAMLLRVPPFEWMAMLVNWMPG